jgi:hypothetical protein
MSQEREVLEKKPMSPLGTEITETIETVETVQEPLKRTFVEKSTRSILVLSIYFILILSIRYFLLEHSQSSVTDRIARLEKAKQMHLDKADELYHQFEYSLTRLGKVAKE